jgi:hypothetical protein
MGPLFVVGTLIFGLRRIAFDWNVGHGVGRALAEERYRWGQLIGNIEPKLEEPVRPKTRHFERRGMGVWK